MTRERKATLCASNGSASNTSVSPSPAECNVMCLCGESILPFALVSGCRIEIKGVEKGNK